MIQEQKKDKKKLYNLHYKSIIIVAALIYPTWPILMAYTNPNLVEFYLLRLFISSSLILFCLMSYKIRYIENKLESIFLVFSILITLLHYYTCYINNLALEFSLSSVLLLYANISLFLKSYYKQSIILLHSFCAISLSLYFGSSNNFSGILSYSVIIASFFFFLNLRASEKIQAILKQHENEKIQLQHWASVGKIAGGIAHTINSPLTTLKLASDMIQKYATENKSDFLKKYSDMIKTESKKIGLITNDLKRLTKKNTPTRTELIEIDQLIAELINDLKVSNATIKFSINNYINEAPIHVLGNKENFVLAINGLLQNSIEALAETSAAEIVISLYDQSTNYKIVIEDNGCGIDSEMQNFLFTPYLSTKEQNGSNGLSLSAVRSIVDTHNGKVYYQNSDTWTTFVVELPKSVAQKNAA